MEVDLVEQAALEELATDRGRVDLDVLAAGRLPADGDRLGDVAVEELEGKRLTSRGVPGLDQEALAILVESGRFDRHLRRVREIYRARRDVLAAEVTAAFGDGSLQGLAAGCHVLLRLPAGVPEEAVVDSSRSMGVRAYGLARYRIDRQRDQPPALVLGFGNVTESQIRRGIRTLARAVAAVAATT